MLNVLYCLLATAQPGLPGWHMFESVDELPAVTDKNGPLAYRAYLPKNAWLTDRSELEEIAKWICKKEPARAPIRVGEKVVCDVR